MVKLCKAPGQPYAHGATVIVAVTGALVVLMAVKEGILLVQKKLVAATAPVKFITFVAAPLQTVWLTGTNTVGTGFTVMVKNREVPWQPFATGVTVMKPDCGTLPVLTGLKEGILPVPLAARPIEGLLLVQLKVVPITAPVKLMALVALPTQTV
jgi:hypothetical protein